MGSNIAPLADELGKIKAAIAELETKEQELRAEIIAAGHDAIEGDIYRVVVIKSVRETLDARAAREKLLELSVSPQWFACHTKKTDVTTVKCAARKAA